MITTSNLSNRNKTPLPVFTLQCLQYNHGSPMLSPFTLFSLSIQGVDQITSLLVRSMAEQMKTTLLPIQIFVNWVMQAWTSDGRDGLLDAVEKYEARKCSRKSSPAALSPSVGTHFLAPQLPVFNTVIIAQIKRHKPPLWEIRWQVIVLPFLWDVTKKDSPLLVHWHKLLL